MQSYYYAINVIYVYYIINAVLESQWRLHAIYMNQKAMLPTPGRIVRRPQSDRNLHDYMAINKYDKYGNT